MSDTGPTVPGMTEPPAVTTPSPSTETGGHLANPAEFAVAAELAATLVRTPPGRSPAL